MMRTPLIVPATMALDDLLTQMKVKRNQIAIVVDEYGGTAGMVTLEDVVERIVGESRTNSNRSTRKSNRSPTAMRV